MIDRRIGRKIERFANRWWVPALALRPQVARFAFVTLLLCAAPVPGEFQGSAQTAPTKTAQRSRISATLFGTDLLIEVEPLEDPVATRDSLADAVDEARELERLLDVGDVLRPEPSANRGSRAINAAAGNGPIPIDRRAFVVLSRALEICRWSRGAYGPLGGMLNGLWGLRQRVGGIPSVATITEQTKLAACDRLELNAEQGTATLAVSSRIDLWGFERGFTADQVVRILFDRGFDNGWVQIGYVIRAFGPGPDGRGWPMEIGSTEIQTERLFLLDRSLAMASARERELEIGGEHFASYIDQRSGRPTGGKAAVLVVSETALDAQALATALFVLDSREGEFYLGTLRPQPAVRWLLGDGEGPPLVIERRWSSIDRWEP